MLDHSDFIGGPHFEADLIGPSGRLARLHKGGASIPKPTKKELEAQKKQEKQFAQMMRQMSRPIPMPEMPTIPLIPPPVEVPPPPPASQSSSDIEDAEQEARRQSGRRYGFLKTTHAGNTGGYMSSSGATPLGGGRTLLG